jgi:cytidine deaminase
VSSAGAVISVGGNEVPRAGGGQYGFIDSGGRDEDLGVDYSTQSLRALVGDTVVKLAAADWLSADRSRQFHADKDLLAREAFDALKAAKADLLNIIEFQRSVHAEAAAIVGAARRGIAVDGSTMYCTTYPCHLCAKEIVCAGITRVYYIEPYPKSRAEVMYGESIHDKVDSDNDKFVAFVPFIGVTPRAYRRLFETEERYRRKDEFGLVKRPDKFAATPRGLSVYEASATASEREIFALGDLPADPVLPEEEREA